jgi:ATP-binding cassette subfamily F protein uup
LDFETASKLPKKLIEAKGISKAHGGRTLFRGLDLLISPGTRLGLLGSNGSGKTTLIRTLLGEEQPDSGEVFRSEHLQVAYFSQNREALDPDLSVAKTLCPRGEFVDFRGTRIHIRSYLDRFLFSPTQMDMAVGRLSGGEQSRVLLARLMLEPANVLVLDEPTNDLDLATLIILEETLTEFEGAIILVSHDRYFLDQVSTRLLAFDEGQVIGFSDLFQWENWRTDQAAEKVARLKASTAPAPTTAAPSPSKKRLGYKDQRELDGMEARIQETEAQLARSTAELENPEIASNAVRLKEVTDRIATLQAEVERLYARWEELLSLSG